MKIVVFPEPNNVELRETAQPAVRAGHVLVETHYTSISAGTELLVLSGELPAIARGTVRYPLVPGYENVGRVVALGDEVSGIDKESWVCCEGTPSFRAFASCWGGHAEYILVPAAEVLPLPAGMPPQRGLFTLLASIALHGVQRAKITLGESVVVFGQGVVGLLALQLARLAGASQIIAVDRLPGRLEMARRLGATETVLVEAGEQGLAGAIDRVLSRTAQRGADVVLEVTGASSVAAAAPLVCRDRGRLALIGMYARPLTFDYWDLYSREIDVLPSQGAGPKDDARVPGLAWTWRRTCEHSLALIGSGRLDVDALITHRFSIDSIAAGYESLRTDPDHTLKVLLSWK
jgi:2-desacetyl-2-hydroxyethyl bacteriochlorophyllide A dehydrogenase